MVAGHRSATSSRRSSVVLRLRALEAFGIELLNGVRSTRNERLGVVIRSEIRKDVIRGLAAIASARAPHSDAQAQEVRRLQSRGDRAETVVPREAAAPACLEPAVLEVDLVVDD